MERKILKKIVKSSQYIIMNQMLAFDWLVQCIIYYTQTKQLQ